MPTHGLIAILGLASIAVPIIIHLLFRQQPKPIHFPAIRFLIARKNESTRRIRFQHLLLLLARCAMLALMGYALSRPIITGSLGIIDQKAPVSAVLVVDNSMSMQFKHQGKTRLELAKEMGKTIINSLPEGSEISIITSMNPVTAVPMAAGSANNRLAKLELEAGNRTLNPAIVVGIRQLAKTELTRREVYVLSDCAQPTWQISEEAKQEIEAAKKLSPIDIRILVLSLAVDKPENVAMGTLMQGSSLVPLGNEPMLNVSLNNSGGAGDRTLTLTLDGETREQKRVAVPAGQATSLSFRLPPMTAGFHQGSVAMNEADPMPFDDARYFTFEVRTAPKVITVVENLNDSLHWNNALAPAEFKRAKKASFEVQTIQASALANADLAGTSMISLINVGQLPEPAWEKLERFVASGGGLFVALGERTSPNFAESKSAKLILPAAPKEAVIAKQGVTFVVDKYNHPLTSKFSEFAETDLPIYPVFKYWRVEAEKEGSPIVMYSDNQPAYLERVAQGGKGGRCVMLTTSAYYRPTNYWTEWPRSWSYLVFADQIGKYLCRLSDVRWNFVPASTVAIETDPAVAFPNYAITNPKQEIDRIRLEANQSNLVFSSTNIIGNYQVDASAEKRTFHRAFSVNIGAEESLLTPVDKDKLIEMLGKDHSSFATDPSKLDQELETGRVGGTDLFGWIMPIVLIVVCLESYLANRFYRQRTARMAT